ncbi:hypothetical protein HPB52_017700 [Rhipicephalus sanguineus]|uniref:Uncharacterized protein n=1 Tax=Rhipicephalus sanguineus TaxID=34632 RepID=A0A9D4PPT4_RHISA|nr:hypothetical protein HPB52_017700 [Rhipicephalus sanguineus]
MREASAVSEFLWTKQLPLLCSWKKSRKKKAMSSAKVTYLGQSSTPDTVDAVLRCGPKFCTVPNENPVTLLSMVRKNSFESSVAGFQLRRYLQLAGQATEALWLPQLRYLRERATRDRRKAEGKVHVPEDLHLPDDVIQVLGLGPKFGVQKQRTNPELLTVVRQMSRRATEEALWLPQLRYLRERATRDRRKAEGKVHVPEDLHLPDDVIQVLGLGPKFGVQKQRTNPELLTVVRQMSRRATEAVAPSWLHGLAVEVEAKRRRPLRPLSSARHSGLHPTVTLPTSIHVPSARSNTPGPTASHTTRTLLAPTFSYVIPGRQFFSTRGLAAQPIVIFVFAQVLPLRFFPCRSVHVGSITPHTIFTHWNQADVPCMGSNFNKLLKSGRRPRYP